MDRMENNCWLYLWAMPLARFFPSLIGCSLPNNSQVILLSADQEKLANKYD